MRIRLDAPFHDSLARPILTDSNTTEADQPTSDSSRKGEEQQASQRPKSAHGLSAAFAPLGLPAYRSFWMAGLISNLGTWMHETGAQWHMTAQDPHPAMVSAVRMAMTLPVFCLALPAGVWADRVDRRSWLLGTQCVLLLIAGAMSVLAYLGMMSPWLLLTFTVAMGIGLILNQPAWQAMTPDLVPPALVPSAVSVGSISFNLARSIGPALAGMVIARIGVWAAFGLNAFSFLAVVAMLLSWKPDSKLLEEDKKRRKKKTDFSSELKKGIFVIQNTPELKNTFLRLFCFALPSSILWTLLSLVATEKLQFAEQGFGVCLATIGVGAVLGGFIVPMLRQRCSSETLVLAMQLVFGVACIIIGAVSQPQWILPVLLVVGTCWMATMTTYNATAQVFLPRKFRARGMAAYMMFFSLGITLGALTWGWLAKWIGLGSAYMLAGICLIVVAMSLHRFKIGSLVVSDS